MEMKSMITTLVTVLVATIVIAAVLIPLVDDFTKPEGQEEYGNDYGGIRMSEMTGKSSISVTGDSVVLKDDEGQYAFTVSSTGYLFASPRCAVIYDDFSKTLMYVGTQGGEAVEISNFSVVITDVPTPRMNVSYRDASGHTQSLPTQDVPEWAYRADPRGTLVCTAPSASTPVYAVYDSEKAVFSGITAVGTASRGSGSSDFASYDDGKLTLFVSEAGSGDTAVARFGATAVEESGEGVMAISSMAFLVNGSVSTPVPFIICDSVLEVGGSEPTATDNLLGVVPILLLLAVILYIFNAMKGGNGRSSVGDSSSDSYEDF